MSDGRSGSGNEAPPECGGRTNGTRYKISSESTHEEFRYQRHAIFYNVPAVGRGRLKCKTAMQSLRKSTECEATGLEAEQFRAR